MQADDNQLNALETVTVHLETGALTVSVNAAEIELGQLCGYAGRKNPKRGFLMVSRVLGKHLPARPSVMRDIYVRLARQIPQDLPGPVLVIGLAETAICLGQGTFEEYARMSGRSDLVFAHTTRYHFAGREVAVNFMEEHCHAPQHTVYLPEDDLHRQLFLNARTIVFVDDEVTTGATFVNLAAAFRQFNPHIETAFACVITDWRGENRTATMNEASVMPLEVLSVLRGEANFTPSPDLQLIKMPAAVGNGEDKSALVSRNYGRFGTVSVPHVADRVEALPILPGQRCLILGTAEFAYVPFLVAEKLEARGVHAFCQSTTRSPAMVSGAMSCAFEFADNYQDGIRNFLYNVRPEEYDAIVLCHETPASTLDPVLIQALGGNLFLLQF